MAGPDVVLTINRVGFMGGVERVLLGCAAGVRQRGIHPVLACPLDGELARAAREAGIETEAIRIDRTKATLSPLALLRQIDSLRQGSADVVRLAQRLKPSVIHVHHPVGGLYALAACRELGIPLLLHVHEVLPPKPLYRLAARRVLPRCAGIVAVSGSSAALMHELGVSDSRLRVIHNGVNPSFLEPVEPAPELAATGPNIGIFGVIEPRKGQDHFLRAAMQLKDRHPTAHFWIIGGVSFAENTAYQQRLEKMAREAGLADRVHFTGHRTDVARWMAGMDVVALASTEFESLPTVLIESAALGRPIVATEVGSVREILNDGSTGLVVRPGDATAMAGAIGRMLSDEGRGFGQRARDDVRARFAPSRFIDDMTALYAGLSRQPRRLEHAA